MQHSGDAEDVAGALIGHVGLDGVELQLATPVTQEVVLEILGQSGTLVDRDVVSARHQHQLQEQE